MIADVKTARLVVRDWAPVLADAGTRKRLEAELAGVLSPAVLAPLPEALALRETVSDWVDALDADSSVKLVRDRADGALLGLAILAEVAPEEVHLGYLLAERAWGRGLATELVCGLVAAAGPVRWRAGVDAANPASVRVLEKCGFRAAGISQAGAMVFVRDGD